MQKGGEAQTGLGIVYERFSCCKREIHFSQMSLAVKSVPSKAWFGMGVAWFEGPRPARHVQRARENQLRQVRRMGKFTISLQSRSPRTVTEAPLGCMSDAPGGGGGTGSTGGGTGWLNTDVGGWRLEELGARAAVWLASDGAGATASGGGTRHGSSPCCAASKVFSIRKPSLRRISRSCGDTFLNCSWSRLTLASASLASRCLTPIGMSKVNRE